MSELKHNNMLWIFSLSKVIVVITNIYDSQNTIIFNQTILSLWDNWESQDVEEVRSHMLDYLEKW